MFGVVKSRTTKVKPTYAKGNHGNWCTVCIHLLLFHCPPVSLGMERMEEDIVGKVQDESQHFSWSIQHMGSRPPTERIPENSYYYIGETIEFIRSEFQRSGEDKWRSRSSALAEIP
jgi:hypothetical protein